MDAIPDDIPVLLDVKRGDIGTTAAAYADACYDNVHGLNADGVTLSPLMGWDSVEPFITGASPIHYEREFRMRSTPYTLVLIVNDYNTYIYLLLLI